MQGLDSKEVIDTIPHRGVQESVTSISRRNDMAKKNFTIWLSPESVEVVERLAAKAEMPVSRLMANIIEVSAPELARVDKVGLWKFSVILSRMQDRLRSFASEVRDIA